MRRLQQIAHRARDGELVVDDEDAKARHSDGCRGRRARRRRRIVGRQVGRREGDAERRTLPRLAVDGDLPPEGRHDPVADRQPEARSYPHGLGREERVENAREHLGGHPFPVVNDLEESVTLCVRANEHADFVPLRVRLLHRLRRVHQQIDDDLLEPALVGPHRPHGLERRRDAGAMADFVARDLDRGVHDGLEVDAASRLVVRPREAAELADDGRDAMRPLPGFLEHGQKRREGRRVARDLRELAGDPLEIEDEIREWIVDLVGHARRQSPEGCESVGLDELHLELFTGGDVAPHAEDRGLALVFEVDGADFEERHGPVGPAHVVGDGRRRRSAPARPRRRALRAMAFSSGPSSSAMGVA